MLAKSFVNTTRIIKLSKKYRAGNNNFGLMVMGYFSCEEEHLICFDFYTHLQRKWDLKSISFGQKYRRNLVGIEQFPQKGKTNLPKVFSLLLE